MLLPLFSLDGRRTACFDFHSTFWTYVARRVLLSNTRDLLIERGPTFEDPFQARSFGPDAFYVESESSRPALTPSVHARAQTHHLLPPPCGCLPAALAPHHHRTTPNTMKIEVDGESALGNGALAPLPPAFARNTPCVYTSRTTARHQSEHAPSRRQRCLSS